jgi:two-component system cell cycle sensor histidine kinase/response regulator CckA
MKRRPAVLVVDDEKKMCASLKTVLEREGYDVATAVSGSAALAAVGDRDFDLFLLDICMPDMDGFRLMAHILSHRPGKPVIMMTGDVSVDSAVRALRQGAYDYLKKPFEPEELLKTVANALHQKMLTEKTRAMESRLKISERRFRFMVHNSPDMIYTLDPNGNFTFINNAAENLFGYRVADLLGKPYHSVLHEADLERARWRFNERRTGKRATAGYELRFKTSRPHDTRDKQHPGYAVVELNATGVYRAHNGGAKKQMVATYGVARDTTYRKILETQLLQAKKMEAIGNLAGGIAHDFNNLLMGIQGIVSLMLFRMEASDPFREPMKTIEQYVQDGAGLTRQLLTFAKGGTLEIQPTDVNALIKKQTRMFGRTHKAIEITESLVPQVLPVEADASQIEQVLLNLYVNAGHAMPEGGRLQVQTENVFLSERDLLTRSSQLKPGRYVKVTISDTGVGMDETTVQRIFDPFFTTKKFGKGSGLGLYCAYGIVKNHGGHIQVVSKRNSGTTFTIYLPACNREITTPAEPSPRSIVGRETILLVDDEQKIRDVCRDGLKLLGYTVVTADSGETALEIYRKLAGAVDVIVLDMVLPGMSGKEIYRRLKAVNPEIRVLLASGYSVGGQEKEILEDGCNGFIQKPFRMEALSMKIQELMEKDCDRTSGTGIGRSCSAAEVVPDIP